MHPSSEAALPRFYLVPDRLRAGDVILTLGDESFSENIASLTGGRFSHAILVASAKQWFEADDEGVGYSDLLWTGAWHQGPGGHGQVIALPHCRAVKVLRHPAMDSHAPAAIESAIKAIVEPWVGETYSDFRRLVKPLTVTSRPPWWVRLGLWWEQLKSGNAPSGKFCSEVVALVYQEFPKHAIGDVALFVSPRAPVLVAPSHLDHSQLKEVPGCVLDAERLGAEHRFQLTFPDCDRRMTTRHARLFRGLDDVRQQLAEKTQKTRAETLEKDRLFRAQLEQWIARSIRSAARFKTPVSGKAMERLLSDLKAHAARMEDHFARDGSNQEYFKLSQDQVELQFRVRDVRADMYEEAHRAGTIEVSPEEFEDNRRRERLGIQADRERARKKFEDFRKEILDRAAAG